MPRRRRETNEELCPICGQYMDVRCIGHRNKPFVDGNTYESICFICFSIPRTFYVTRGKAEDGSEDIWEGPFFDSYHLWTPEQLVKEEFITESLKAAKISHKALMNKIKIARKKGKID